MNLEMPDFMEGMLLSEFSELLFRLDLAHTSCKENDNFDEYDSIAQFILEDFQDTKDFEQSVYNIFEDFFMMEPEEIDFEALMREF